MGYATIGYPTRTHKRRQLPSHEELPIYYHNHKIKQAAKHLKRNGKTLTKRPSKCTKRQKLTLQSLPIEIIQRIFVLVKDVSGLPLLNKHFYKSLRPTASLIRDVMFEKYILNPEDYGYKDYTGIDKTKLMMLCELWNDKIFSKYYIENYESLTDDIVAFFPGELMKSISHEIEGTNDCIDFSDKPFEYIDFPEYFYHNFDSYFQDLHFLRSLEKYFSYQNVNLALTNLIEWFFTEQDSYIASDLFERIETMIRISSNGTDPFSLPDLLYTMIHALFVENTGREQDQLLFVFGCSSIETLSKKKLSFIESFISNFYAQTEDMSYQETLSDPGIWELLNRIFNLKLMDIIEGFGATPQYHIIV